MKLFKILILFFLLSNLFFSCKKRGCSDPDALNYDKNANKDDHSCYYYWVGQRYGGGLIYYIDQTKKHGLIVAEFDLPNTQWGCYDSTINGADEVGVGAGSQNTLDIVNGCNSITAAFLCNSYDTLGYNDWYLPSKEEMKGLIVNLGCVGQGNLNGYYWSSTEFDSGSAWCVSSANSAFVTLSKSSAYSVRPVRSF